MKKVVDISKWDSNIWAIMAKTNELLKKKGRELDFGYILSSSNYKEALIRCFSLLQEAGYRLTFKGKRLWI